jgi:NAD(P)-dependent dehydrogenase (short-subunit alcohol dehydrogenase family)
MSSETDMTGKRVLVTGGTKGIGRQIASLFAKRGAEVVICGRNPPSPSPDQQDGNLRFVATDVRDLPGLEELVKFTCDTLGGIDVLVNNAGGSPPVDAATVSPRFSQAIIELNLIAPLHLSQKVNTIMQNQQQGGVILNIGSVAGMRPSPSTAAYGAAKAGLINLTRTLAIEWAPKVRVNAISPGPTESENTDAHFGTSETREAISHSIPLGRLGSPNDVADACLFLASSRASYISGTNLLIDGGGEIPPYFQARQE